MQRLPRPGAGRSAARRSQRARRSTRRLTPTGAASVGLTTRAAALGLVLCALVVSAALPLREYLAQRGRIAELETAQAAQQKRVAGLEQLRTRLDDPSYVAALARERLYFVRPGETTYVVLGEQAPAPLTDPAATARPVSPTDPWWSQVWGSVRAADAAPVR